VSTGKLGLDPRVVRAARRLAAAAAEPVIELARTHTTVSVERATLRLAGLSGAADAGQGAPDGGSRPWVNVVTDAVAEQVGLENGAALPVWHSLLTGDCRDLTELATRTEAGAVRFVLPAGPAAQRARHAARRAVAAGLSAVDRRRRERATRHGSRGFT